MCGHMGRSMVHDTRGLWYAQAGQVDGIAEYAKVCTERAKLTENARNTPISLFFADLGGSNYTHIMIYPHNRGTEKAFFLGFSVILTTIVVKIRVQSDFLSP